jgi:hypothetical protein
MGRQRLHHQPQRDRERAEHRRHLDDLSLDALDALAGEEVERDEPLVFGAGPEPPVRGRAATAIEPPPGNDRP